MPQETKPPQVTLKEFGAQIKSKYPQYAKYGDEEIGTRMLAKYPQYKENIKPFESDTGAREMPAFPSTQRVPFGIAPMIDPTKPSIMSEMAAEAVRGIPEAITNIPKIPAALWNILKQSPYLGNRPDLGMLGAAASPVTTPAKQAIELMRPGTVNAPTPESPESRQAARAAGTMLASAELPNLAAGAVQLAKPAVTGLGRMIQRGIVNPPIVNKWMGVHEKWLKHGANPGKELMDSKLLTGTKEGTLANVQTELKAIGQTLDTKLKAGTQRGILIDGEQILDDALQQAAKAARGSESAFQNSLLRVVDNAYREFPDLKALNPERAHQFKVWIGESAKFETVPSVVDAQLNDVFLGVYGKVNDAIKTQVGQNIAADLRKWGNLYQARKALETGIRRDAVGTGTGSMTGVAAKRVAKPVGIAAAAAGGGITLKKLVD